MTQNDVANWSDVADQWIAWVRAEDHDAFWAYRSAFETFIGAGSGKAVEIGAGEGRICRVLQGLGYQMTAVEPVAALLRAAQDSNSADTYINAPATRLPLADNAFDLVVLYNVLMDVDDLQGAVDAAARSLGPKGRVVVGIVHPIFDIVSAKDRAAAVPYFDATAFDVDIAGDGPSMRFRGWQRPLGDYINACAAAGLYVARMCEPQPDPDHPVTAKHPDWAQVPLFLWLELRALPNQSQKETRT